MSASGFAGLGLLPGLMRALTEQGWGQPTPIQVAAIPPALAGRDVLATAQTGSGKTAAFLLPLLQRLALSARPVERRGRTPVQALVLVPTRELAAQVAAQAQALLPGLGLPLRVSVLFGGVSINPQLLALRGGAELVVATPGRLLDVVDKNGLDLSSLRSLVLDEADHLLDAGFAEELSRVLALLPRERQTLMFSATFAPALQALARRLLHEPVRVEVAPDVAPAEAPAAAPPGQLTERAIRVDVAQRTSLLKQLIAEGQWPRVLVFVATRYACDHVADKLRRAGLKAEAFHGDASQGARTRLLGAFRAGELQVLVATDLGARGIDIAQLPAVVNYDLPRAAVDYVHRIGRTARAGAAGVAVSFVSASTEAHFRLIERRQGYRVEREQLPGFEPTDEAPADAGTGGIKGKRPSKKDKLRAAKAAQD